MKFLSSKYELLWHWDWEWDARWVAWPNIDPDFTVFRFIQLGFLEIRSTNRKWQRMS